MLSEADIAAAYQRFGHLVRRRCQYLLRDPQQADDALQEVFVRLIRYGKAFEQADSPVRWLYRVAEHVCFDAIKSRRRQPNPVDRPDQLEPADGAVQATPFKQAAEREAVEQVLGELKDTRMRQVALLYYLDGLTQERIGAELGCSRQTVNKTLAKIQARASRLQCRLRKP